MVARLRSIATMIFRRSRWEEELKEELQFHLEARADALVRAGLSHEEAMRRARVEFGRLDRSKEGCREARGGRWIDDLSRNLVVAGRSIRKNPGFSLVAVLSLALGIGGNLAVFKHRAATPAHRAPRARGRPAVRTGRGLLTRCLFAGWWPARRAARLDPSKTLRFE